MKKLIFKKFEVQEIRKIHFKNLDIKTISDHVILYTSAKPQKVIPFIQRKL